jgi:tRNA(Arg) A34 adenosine deaminase TadA
VSLSLTLRFAPFTPPPTPISQAERGFEAREVPIGVVIIEDATGKVLAATHNATNATYNVRPAGVYFALHAHN